MGVGLKKTALSSVRLSCIVNAPFVFGFSQPYFCLEPFSVDDVVHGGVPVNRKRSLLN